MPATINRTALAAARQRLAQVPRDVLCTVAADLVAGSPVRSGLYRASWTIALDGAPLDAAPVAPDPDGAATVARLQAEIRAAPDKATIGFRNTTPYARRIEYGWSRQAPFGVVRVTLARAPVIAAEVMSQGRSTS